MSSTAVDANPAGRIPWESLTDDQRKTFVRVLPPDYEADDIRNRWQSIDQQIWLDDWDRGADARKESDDRRQAERERARRAEIDRVRSTNPILQGIVSDGAITADDYADPLAAGGDFIVPGAAVVIVYGLAESGKSFLMTTFACSLASGTPWLGLTDTVRGPVKVLYLQLEGPAEQVEQRILAWEAENGCTVYGENLIHVCLPGFDLTGPDAGEHLIKAATTEDIDVLIIDTLDAGRPGGSNMIDSDVGAIFARLLPQITNWGISTILVAHSNESDKSLAGLSRQRNHAECMIHVQERQHGNRVAVMDKNKDVAGKPAVSFYIEDSCRANPVTGRPVGVVRVGSKSTPKKTGDAAPLSDDEIMLQAVVDNPGASLRQLRRAAPAVKGGDHARDAALGRLVLAGRVRVDQVGQRRSHYAI